MMCMLRSVTRKTGSTVKIKYALGSERKTKPVLFLFFLITLFSVDHFDDFFNVITSKSAHILIYRLTFTSCRTT